MNNCKIQKYRK